MHQWWRENKILEWNGELPFQDDDKLGHRGGRLVPPAHVHGRGKSKQRKEKVKVIQTNHKLLFLSFSFSLFLSYCSQACWFPSKQIPNIPLKVPWSARLIGAFCPRSTLNKNIVLPCAGRGRHYVRKPRKTLHRAEGRPRRPRLGWQP